MPGEADSIEKLTTAFNAVRDLLESNLQTSNSSHAIITTLGDVLHKVLDNQKSGATGRLDAQAVRQAEQERRLEAVEGWLVKIGTRTDTLTRMAREQRELTILPFWERVRRIRIARKRWREGYDD
jgi:hypothetical protein